MLDKSDQSGMRSQALKVAIGQNALAQRGPGKFSGEYLDGNLPEPAGVSTFEVPDGHGRVRLVIPLPGVCQRIDACYVVVRLT